MRPPRGPFGPGAVLLFAAMVVIPEVLRQFKPFAKTVGETVVKIGEGIQRLAETESPSGPAPTSEVDEPATETVAEATDEGSATAEAVPPEPERPKKAPGRKKPTEDASST